MDRLVNSDRPRSSGLRAVVAKAAAVMGFVAFTLAVAAFLHLSGRVHGRGQPFDASGAGIAEAVIGAALGIGAAVMVRFPKPARTVGIVLSSLAAVGFLIGLSMTSRGGDLPDIAYHLIFLPVLVGIVIVLARTPRQESAGEDGSGKLLSATGRAGRS